MGGEENPLSPLDCWILENGKYSYINIKSTDSINDIVYVKSAQFDFRGGTINKRIVAQRAPFYKYYPEYDIEKLTLSHLCHNSWCFNPSHHVLETLATNKGRNGCPGPDNGCKHNVPCIIPGPYYKGDNITFTIDGIIKF